MKHRLIQILWLWSLVVVLVGAGVAGISIMAHAQSDPRVPMNGQTAPLIQQAQMIGNVQSQQPMQLSIGLQLRHKTALQQLLQSLYQPGSAQYHQFLTPQQFEARFSPTAEQQQQVVDYLNNQGLKVDSVSSNGLLIDAHGTTSQVETAFDVSMHNYRLGNHTFYANANEPTMSAALSPLIMSVGGLDNSVQYQPLAYRASQASVAYNQPQLAGAYDIDPLYQAGTQGANQNIAVFELDGYQPADINAFAVEHDLTPPALTNVPVDGFNGAAGSGAIEAELDLEVISEIAPQAHQLVYEGPNSTQGVNDTYNRIVTDDQAHVVSVSWGQCEAQAGATELQTLDAIFQQAAAQGISIFAAAGDSGAFDCATQHLAVDSPASDPYVTGVGGTTLQLAGDNTYGNESAWSNPASVQRSANGTGGGGGISSFFKQPTWQTGPGVTNQFSNGQREVPDVSANADPRTGYAVFCTATASKCPATGNIVVGGTSGAAPLWAASTALINEFQQQNGRGRIGWAEPNLYSLASTQQPYLPFHDVTTGTNLFYPATPNYDQATGLGSPDVYNIARDELAS
jgi:subtilase family serine protease